MVSVCPTRSLAVSAARLCCRDFNCFSSIFACSNDCSSFFSISLTGEFRDSAKAKIRFTSARDCSAATSPATASTRRTPAAIADSAVIRKRPISPVARVWVPPHSSIEKPLRPLVSPPICTTRTVSPYLSPKNWRMSPRLVTSPCGVSVQLTPQFSTMRWLTSCSMSATWRGVSAWLLKSKVNLSGPTYEPFCEASGPATSCNAQWKIWVTV